MDFGKLLARVTAILTQPNSEWPVIAGESSDTGALYSKYIVWLAAIPAVCGFVKGSLIGYGAFGVHIRDGIGAGLGRMVLMYILTLVLVYVVALIINALAGKFGAQKNQLQALKTAAYAYTAAWVAGFGQIIPWLGWLIAIAGGIYSIYLLYLGLPHTMQCPKEKAGGYTAVTVVITVVLSWILMLAVGGMFAATGANTLGGGSTSSSTVTYDPDSRMGKLKAMSERMQAASKDMEAAQASGDSEASGRALGAMAAAMSGDKEPVEALSSKQIKAFLPDSVNGLKRSGLSAARNTAAGIQTAQAKAQYQSAKGADNYQHIALKVTDTGGAKGLMGLAGMFSSDTDKQTEKGFERSYSKKGQRFEEKWDNKRKSGSYSVFVANRFKVEASGTVGSFDDLKRAVASVDLKGLEKLKDAGVKK